jgi:hypothetical protein
VRPHVLAINLDDNWTYYWVVATVGFLVKGALWRFLRSTVGTVLVAIRENEQRARFIGYPTNRYKLLGFVISACVVGTAGILSTMNHRFASADPLDVAFSGELLAMAVIGGMRSFLGPALGALFYILFREFLAIYTAYWLLYFGLLLASLCSHQPAGRPPSEWRLSGRSRGPVMVAVATNRCRHSAPAQYWWADLQVSGLVANFGGIRAVQGVSRARGMICISDVPNGAKIANACPAWFHRLARGLCVGRRPRLRPSHARASAAVPDYPVLHRRSRENPGRTGATPHA